MVRLRTAAMNRAHGVCSQWGSRRARAAAQAGRDGALIERGMPEVWRRSIAEALAVIEMLDERIAPLEQELAADSRAPTRASQLLVTIPGVGDLLALDDRRRDR